MHQYDAPTRENNPVAIILKRLIIEEKLIRLGQLISPLLPAMNDEYRLQFRKKTTHQLMKTGYVHRLIALIGM